MWLFKTVTQQLLAWVAAFNNALLIEQATASHEYSAYPYRGPVGNTVVGLCGDGLWVEYYDIGIRSHL